jgi:hypothetical protein
MIAGRSVAPFPNRHDRTSSRFGRRRWLASSRALPGPIALGRLDKSGGCRLTHHPFARLAATPPYDFDLRRDVLARDRLVLPKQSAEPGTAGGPCDTRSIVSASGHAAHAADDSKASLDRAPLLRFNPLQHTPAAARYPGRPASGRSRFDVCPITPAHLRTDDRPSSMRFSAGQSRCDGARCGGRLREKRSSRIRHLYPRV